MRTAALLAVATLVLGACSQDGDPQVTDGTPEVAAAVEGDDAEYTGGAPDSDLDRLEAEGVEAAVELSAAALAACSERTASAVAAAVPWEPEMRSYDMFGMHGCEYFDPHGMEYRIPERVIVLHAAPGSDERRIADFYEARSSADICPPPEPEFEFECSLDGTGEDKVYRIYSWAKVSSNVAGNLYRPVDGGFVWVNFVADDSRYSVAEVRQIVEIAVEVFGR
jgi:hypothetical protein